MASALSFVDFPIEETHQSIAERFEKQVLLHPTRLAIKTPTVTLSYEELNRMANHIARAVVDRVETRPEPVALCFDGGAALIAAGLGVLKAGKAYAALDVQLPKAPARRVLADLGSKLLLTDGKNTAVARERAGKARTVFNIDDLDLSLPADRPGPAGAPQDLAYIGFTSGSTGSPRGVMWDHRSELFGIRAKARALRIAAEDRISLLRANTVGAMRDIHLALLNGAAVVAGDLQDARLASLARWLRQEEITVFSCVATIFRQAVESAAGPQDFARIRIVHIGGEPVFKADVEHYKKYFSDGCRFVNRYSISETQAVSYFFIDKRTEIVGERVPAGYALEGSEIRVLDPNGRELGPGEVGEIAICSPYLALGYWRRPKLTAEKFCADPADPAVRNYRTGDLGYLSADGCLVPVGRKDFQTKIRGHRVEPEAVEAALLKFSPVRQAAVIACEGRRGMRLIAYVATEKNTATNVKRLRRELRRRLPPHMIPSAFVFLDRLPLTAGGKTDRRALPAPPAVENETKGGSLAAGSAVERALLILWRDALEIAELGTD